MTIVEFGDNIQLNNIDRGNRIDFQDSLRGLANFIGARKVFYDDLGNGGESFKFYKGSTCLTFSISDGYMGWTIEEENDGKN